MHSSIKNYNDIYRLQDKVLNKLTGRYGNLYLTGGSALGRFYLNHRYSDDLDLFTNADPDFGKYTTAIHHYLSDTFPLSMDRLILYKGISKNLC